MRIHRNFPLSEQISTIMRERILSGDYLPGTQIPSEIDLSNEFDISRATVRTALASMVSEGLLFRKQGLGTFVAPRNRLISGIERLESVISMAIRQGQETSTENLEVEYKSINSRIADQLQVPEGTLVTNVRRTILVDRERVSYQEDYILRNWLEIDDIDDDFTGSVLDILKIKHGSSIDRAIAEFTATFPTQTVVEMLGISTKIPLILLNETLYSIDSTSMCFSNNYFIPDKFCWQVVRRYK